MSDEGSELSRYLASLFDYLFNWSGKRWSSKLEFFLIYRPGHFFLFHSKKVHSITDIYDATVLVDHQFVIKESLWIMKWYTAPNNF